LVCVLRRRELSIVRRSNSRFLLLPLFPVPVSLSGWFFMSTPRIYPGVLTLFFGKHRLD
jgi:hypothetical protein